MTRRYEAPRCKKHGYVTHWHECEACDAQGFAGHDCGEDCCVCLDPEDNVHCNICHGEGGWWRCYTCDPLREEDQ